MSWALGVPFLAGFMLVGLTRFAARRMEPRAASWSITISAGVIAVATTASLALTAWPLAARLPAVAHRGEWSTGAVSHGVPIPLPISVIAGLVLALVAWRFVRTAVAIVSAASRVWTTQRACAAAGSGNLVVVDDVLPLAYAVPGLTTAGGRTVVSNSLLASLENNERQAVLAHERAHLANRHHLFAIALDVTVSLNPLLRPVKHEARFALERWADEVAATASDRSTVGRALAKTALAQIERVDSRGPGRSLLLHAGDLRVSARVAALLDDAAEGRPSVHRLVVASAVIAVVAVAWASHDMERVFEALRLVG